jgi:hypothetical protein
MMPNVIDTIQSEAILLLLVVIRDLQDTTFLFRKLWCQDIKSGQEGTRFAHSSAELSMAQTHDRYIPTAAERVQIG